MEIVPELDARQSQALRQRAGDFSQMLVRALMATVREGGERPATRASAVRDLREVLRALAAEGAGELAAGEFAAPVQLVREDNAILLETLRFH